jgi:peptide/nickel transport system substrate-binding protein
MEYFDTTHTRMQTPQHEFGITRFVSISKFAYLNDLLRRFSPSERLALYVLSILLASSVFILLAVLNNMFLISIPEHGGHVTEGEVGTARFINPLLAISGPDKDITELVYSGLMRASPDGTLIPDLAESYTISSDGTIYTFKMRNNATFHDGKPITSADVAFTVKAAQDTALKSPREADWVGVSVSTPDAHTVVFTLPHAYAPFIENTTMGILPKHLWQDVSDREFAYTKLNTHPIGSGPYKVTNVQTDSTGSVIRYDLDAFTHFTLGTPYVSSFTFLFYPNTDALKKAFVAGTIDAIAGVDPADITSLHKSRPDSAIVRVTLPRVFGVFFNQSHNPALTDASVRKALDAAIDKTALVHRVLGGYGDVLDGPIPRGVIGEKTLATSTNIAIGTTTVATTTHTMLTNASDATASSSSVMTDRARAILQGGGWKYNDTDGIWEKGKLKLAIVLATADEPELVATAHAVAENWRAVGVHVDVRVYPLSDFNTTVLRPRNYDAILFGEVVGRSADLFAFWHSSQRNDPGLNLSMYANIQTDALLSRARSTTDEKTREALYQQFTTIIKKDTPAVFLYSPELLYILPPSLQGVMMGTITNPAERFLNVYQWYTQTERVWSVFVK